MLSGWGNYPRIATRLLRARGTAEIEAITAANPTLIARGNGRSYGDAALNANTTLSTLRHDRILAFDRTTGHITCESGLLLSDLLSIIVPLGWFVPVTPGTRFVTIGGMVAADVHGKNHHRNGSFGAHVERLTLLLANGETRTCSAAENADLFAATCGGMGLTGIILSVTFRLLPIETAYIKQHTTRTRTITETMDACEASGSATYSVAWIDCLAKGNALGRGLVYTGEHARREEIVAPNHPLTIPHPRPKRIPFNLPPYLLNRWSITAFNTLYYSQARLGTALIDYETFFYPLDKLLDWNRIYGRRGFVQYQCVLPTEASRTAIPDLLARVRKAGLGSFLAVLKLLGPGTTGYLSFPMPGYTIALDFPAIPATFTLLNELDAITTHHGGRIYLAKDARMDKSMLAGYPDLAAFRALRTRYDPDHKFSSLQSERLGL